MSGPPLHIWLADNGGGESPNSSHIHLIGIPHMPWKRAYKREGEKQTHPNGRPPQCSEEVIHMYGVMTAAIQQVAPSRLSPGTLARERYESSENFAVNR